MKQEIIKTCTKCGKNTLYIIDDEKHAKEIKERNDEICFPCNFIEMISKGECEK